MSRIPSWWQRPVLYKTRTELKDSQKQIPHASFDVDRDGFVSQTDLLVASHFDKDKDGKLNSEERSAAEQALKEGFLEQFDFNQGRNRGRSIQIRGVIVNNEDFSSVQGTYVQKEHANPPKFRSYSELKEYRKSTRKADGEISANKLVHKPALLEFERPAEAYQPMMNYVANPKDRCRSEMRERRKQELIDDQNRACNYAHKLSQQKIFEREALRYASFDMYSESLTEIKKNKIKQDDARHYINNFVSAKSGIHPQPLPSFYENLAACWKDKYKVFSENQNDYVSVRTPDKKIVYRALTPDLTNEKIKSKPKPDISSLIKFKEKKTSEESCKKSYVVKRPARNFLTNRPRSCMFTKRRRATIRTSGFEHN